jgi:hypothetical protein
MEIIQSHHQQITYHQSPNKTSTGLHHPDEIDLLDHLLSQVLLIRDKDLHHLITPLREFHLGMKGLLIGIHLLEAVLLLLHLLLSFHLGLSL